MKRIWNGKKKLPITDFLFLLYQETILFWKIALHQGLSTSLVLLLTKLIWASNKNIWHSSKASKSRLPVVFKGDFQSSPKFEFHRWHNVFKGKNAFGQWDRKILLPISLLNSKYNCKWGDSCWYMGKGETVDKESKPNIKREIVTKGIP